MTENSHSPTLEKPSTNVDRTEMIGLLRRLCSTTMVLLEHLPDSQCHGKDWTWCWNDLNDESQDVVKEARAKGAKALVDMGSEIRKLVKESTSTTAS